MGSEGDEEEDAMAEIGSAVYPYQSSVEATTRGSTGGWEAATPYRKGAATGRRHCGGMGAVLPRMLYVGTVGGDEKIDRGWQCCLSSSDVATTTDVRS